DTYVVFNSTKEKRDSYFVWKEQGRVPAVVIEYTSESTKDEDIGRKFKVYERLGVAEYYLFDPRREWIHTRLRGFKLAAGRYVQMELQDDRLYSEQLALFLVEVEDDLRFLNPLTGEFLPTPYELHLKAQAAQEQAEAAQEQAETAKAQSQAS